MPTAHSAVRAGFCQGRWAAWRGRGRSPREGGAQPGTAVGEAAAEPAAAGGVAKPRATSGGWCCAPWASPQPSSQPAANHHGFLLLALAPGAGPWLGSWRQPGGWRPTQTSCTFMHPPGNRAVRGIGRPAAAAEGCFALLWVLLWEEQGLVSACSFFFLTALLCMQLETFPACWQLHGKAAGMFIGLGFFSPSFFPVAGGACC